jgi:hypothetical protein
VLLHLLLWLPIKLFDGQQKLLLVLLLLMLQYGSFSTAAAALQV